MEVLVTGAGGFVGGHLLSYLRSLPDMNLHGTIIGDVERRPPLTTLCPQLWEVDLRDEAAVTDLLATIRPDHIYHLAGQSSPSRSFEAPWDTLETNIRGTLNLLQAIQKLKLSTRMLNIGSAEMYGTVKPEYLPLKEDASFHPVNPYSVSKIAQDMLALQYTQAYHLFVVRMRPFNHIGPGQNPQFSVPNWAGQIAEAELGQREPVIYVGDLSAARDFTDVRDVVRAYVLALTEGEAGAVYHVCSGKAHVMRTVLDTLVSYSKIPVTVQVDPQRVRPVEIPVLVGDCSRLRERTGWSPQIPIEQSLRDVLDEWRQRVSVQLANTANH